MKNIENHDHLVSDFDWHEIYEELSKKYEFIDTVYSLDDLKTYIKENKLNYNDISIHEYSGEFHIFKIKKMEIGKRYDVIFAEFNDGGFEKMEMELLEIKNYKGKEIYVFEDDGGHLLIQYDHKENIDWDFIEEINEKFGEF